MRYQIQSRSDLASGMTLTVRFPEEELDRKALYTIQADCPEFLLPFRYRNMDGAVECTYRLGDCVKLQYRCGERTPEETTRFWERVLRPILDCPDWFLKPFSFVLDPQYLYTDRDGKVIRFVYIPTRPDCMEEDSLRSMAAELSRQNPVTDPALENKVLRAIMQDFQPQAFLHMLEGEQRQAPSPQAPERTPHASVSDAAKEVSERPCSEVPAPPASDPGGGPEDIVIHFDEGSREKKEKKGHGLFGGKKEKKEKKEEERSASKRSGLFGRKKAGPGREIMLGAAAEEPAPAGPPEREEPPAPRLPGPEDDGDVTQLGDLSGGTCLRLVGDVTLPREIPVELEPGQAFTIGRFDASVGHRQSSFEFDKRTKAVSRHHAAIERTADGGYTLVDLMSKAGTFLNGQRLTPNVPHVLTSGCRVSFGTGGADYIWEELNF